MEIKKKERKKLSGRIRLIAKNILTGKIEISDWHKNYITAVGCDAILNRLAGLNLKANEGKITYGAVGTGAIAPSVSSTTISGEFATSRQVVNSAEVSNGILLIRVFFDKAEANGTLTNFGLFGEDATSTADTGTLFEIVNISYTKTAAVTLTIEVEINLN